MGSSTPTRPTPSLAEAEFAAAQEREISGHLYLSINTVKARTASLYRKLGVGSRDAAARQARAIRLIDSDESAG